MNRLLGRPVHQRSIQLKESKMEYLMATLSFGTLGGFAVFAYLNARATDKLKDDPNHKPSTLCAQSDHWSAAK